MRHIIIRICIRWVTFIGGSNCMVMGNITKIIIKKTIITICNHTHNIKIYNIYFAITCMNLRVLCIGICFTQERDVPCHFITL